MTELTNILEKISSEPRRQNPDLLSGLVDWIRPKRPQDAEQAAERIGQLNTLLGQNPFWNRNLRIYLLTILTKKDLIRLLTDLGILSSEGFFSEGRRKISYRFLPPQPNPNNLSVLVRLVFKKNTDGQWVSGVSDEVWEALFQTLRIPSVFTLRASHPVIKRWLDAINILSLRITTIGLEPQLVDRQPELEKRESPFMSQNLEVDDYILKFEQEGFDRSTQIRITNKFLC
ncbi:MAG: site-specific recombinase [Bacteroidia bacterium]|nr:site-specific recombinase [Bacteroidia bacterium]